MVGPGLETQSSLDCLIRGPFLGSYQRQIFALDHLVPVFLIPNALSDSILRWDSNPDLAAESLLLEPAELNGHLAQLVPTPVPELLISGKRNQRMRETLTIL